MRNYNPVGLGILAIIGIGVLFLLFSVVPVSELTGGDEELLDPASAAALAQATELLDLAKDKTMSEAFNSDSDTVSDMIIEDYRIRDQRFETRFDVSVLAAHRGSRGSNICLTLELDIEENTLTMLDVFDSKDEHNSNDC